MSGASDPVEMTRVADTADDAEVVADLPVFETMRSDFTLETEIVEHLVNSGVTFKSQQKSDPELTPDEKRRIGLELLYRSRGLFLAKFGKYLKKDHLNYFAPSEDDYEIRYHLNRLRRYLDEGARRLDIKNRRYQALKMLVEKGEYFSETEMMKRDPLLYENLIGRFLTEKEKMKRDNIDTTSITFVNLLLESIERDRLRNVRRAQEEAEDEVREENDTDDDSDDNGESKSTTDDEDKPHWGEVPGTSERNYRKESKRRKSPSQNVPFKERQILREEFVTQMYENFLDGKDVEFDYSTVDDNEAYDNVEMRSHDEEEKYFDSESPETVLVENVREDNDTEDELDVYMGSLKIRPDGTLDKEAAIDKVPDAPFHDGLVNAISACANNVGANKCETARLAFECMVEKGVPQLMTGQ